jgi:carbon-monoxide dehydrogenase large subunit
MGLTYDSGDFAGNMDRALALSDWAEHAGRRNQAAVRGRLGGIGLANYIESPVGDPRERVRLTVGAGGTVDLVTGTQSTGQGHETSFAQVTADLLGVPFEAIRVHGGDTRLVGMGGGSHSDRSMRLVGTLLVDAAAEIVAQGRAACAELWGVGVDEVAFEDGCFRAPGANRALSLLELADMLDDGARARLAATQDFAGRLPAHPTGCAVCEVEVDPETGTVEIVRYTTVDDVGRPINPLIVDGQVHGGIAQGIGEALIEACVFDPETGQPLAGSFMDYGLPRADMLPPFTVELAEDPTAGNPLAVKGGGEAGITPAIAAVANAIVDALRDFEVEHVDLPATPERVWRAMQGGNAGA